MKTKLESDTGSNPPACSRSSETPETDAVEFEVIDDYECGINVVSSCLARKLERERDAARSWVKWSAREWEHRRHADWPSTLLTAARALKIIPENAIGHPAATTKAGTRQETLSPSDGPTR